MTGAPPLTPATDTTAHLATSKQPRVSSTPSPAFTTADVSTVCKIWLMRSLTFFIDMLPKDAFLRIDWNVPCAAKRRYNWMTSWGHATCFSEKTFSWISLSFVPGDCSFFWFSQKLGDIFELSVLHWCQTGQLCQWHRLWWWRITVVT